MRLPLQPVDCESTVENWLPAVIATVKSTLQVGLASALGMPVPDGLKVVGPSPSLESTSKESKEVVRRTSVSPQQRKVFFAPETEAVRTLENTARSEMNLPSSWSLRNTNEIVILALQIELTQRFENCFRDVQSGDRDSLERMHQHLSAILRSAAGLLQGANASDRVHEVITQHQSDIQQSMSQDKAKDQGTEETLTNDQVNPEVRFLLSPSQVQKLTNLILLLSSKRDLAVKLSNLAKSRDQNENEDGTAQLTRIFEWQSQLKYVWSQPNATCKVSVMDYDCEYGFEYQGTAARMVSTVETEKSLFWITQGMASYMPCLLIGSTVRNYLISKTKDGMVFHPIYHCLHN